MKLFNRNTGRRYICKPPKPARFRKHTPRRYTPYLHQGRYWLHLYNWTAGKNNIYDLAYLAETDDGSFLEGTVDAALNHFWRQRGAM